MFIVHTAVYPSVILIQVEISLTRKTIGNGISYSVAGVLVGNVNDIASVWINKCSVPYCRAPFPLCSIFRGQLGVVTRTVRFRNKLDCTSEMVAAVSVILYVAFEARKHVPRSPPLECTRDKHH